MRAGHELVVVGSANVDLVVGVERRPGAGETVLGGDLAVHPGGKGANQAVAAARLGARTALLARLGDDDHGRLLSGSLAADGVDLSAVLTSDAPTGVAMITVDASGDNSIVVSPGANSRLLPADVHAARDLLAGAAVVSLQWEIPPRTVAAAAGAARRAGARVVLNPSPPSELAPGVLAAADPLVVNEHEARMLCAGTPGGAADDDPASRAALLLASGPRSVVVTLGPRGALVLDDRGPSRVPAPRVDVVDTTGAGDAFTGALAWRLAVGDALREAVRRAVRAGAFAVTRAGAQDSFPTEEELRALR